MTDLIIIVESWFCYIANFIPVARKTKGLKKKNFLKLEKNKTKNKNKQTNNNKQTKAKTKTRTTLTETIFDGYSCYCSENAYSTVFF